MLDFWATWCGPCRAEMPDVKEVYNHFDHSKFEIIGISLDGGSTRTSLSLVKGYVDVSKIKWPITFDDRGWENAIAKGYRVHAIPRNIVIDQNGVIRLVITEGIDRNQVEKLISKLIDNDASAGK